MLTDSDVERWLREDVGHRDVSNQMPGETTGRLVAKEAGTVAGLDAARRVFGYLDCTVTTGVEAGDRVQPGDRLLRVEGPTTQVLRGERVAVNILGHASGVATKTAAAVDAARSVSDSVTVAGTRKTTPGLRGVEKRAITAGGGDPHRLTLSDTVMVKDNHVAALGLEDAIEHVRERTSFTTNLDVEVEQPAAAPRAAEAGADIVLLDNMPPAETARAVDLVASASDPSSDVLTEASGGITVAAVPEYADTGVDVISLGTLTHSAPALDCSLRTGGSEPTG